MALARGPSRFQELNQMEDNMLCPQTTGVMDRHRGIKDLKCLREGVDYAGCVQK
jgi:hypothetical protein